MPPLTERLPPLWIDGSACRLPLSEPSAAALAGVLLEPAGMDAVAVLCDAISLDPALALFAAHHHAVANNGAAAPSVEALAAWFSPRLLQILTFDESQGAEASGSNDRLKAADRRQLGALSADAVAAAEAISQPDARLTEPAYLCALLRSSTALLTAAGHPTPQTARLLGWLGSAIAANRTTGATTAKESARRRPPKKRSRNGARPAGREAEARARWNVAAGFATAHLAPLAARLARAAELEAQFDERLEEEKLAAMAEFAAGAGHEINNPLAVISGRAQLFLRHESDPERRRELAVINTQARRVHEMIADLMLFARPPAPRLADCSVADVVNSVAAELQMRAAEMGVTLSTSMTDNLPTLSADANQLKVAVRAVCENALDWIAAGGRIDVHCAATTAQALDGQESQVVLITVRDTGPGLSVEGRRHAFDPFYSGRAAGRGLGLGLSKCWRIVTAHGGSVEIDTNDSGTAVTIRLPAVLCVIDSE